MHLMNNYMVNRKTKYCNVKTTKHNFLLCTRILLIKHDYALNF